MFYTRSGHEYVIISHNFYQLKLCYAVGVVICGICQTVNERITLVFSMSKAP